MTARPELTRLRKAAARLERAEAAVERARAERDELILDALHVRATVAEVAEAGGVSVPRVYQVRAGVR